MNNTFQLNLQAVFKWQLFLLLVLGMLLASFDTLPGSRVKTTDQKTVDSNGNLNVPANYTNSTSTENDHDDDDDDDETDCTKAQNWLKSTNLIVLENLTNVRDVDYNTFVGDELVSISQSGNQMSTSLFPSYSMRSLEVAGKVKSGNDINLFYSGAFGNSNTIVQQNTTQYHVNGRRFNANHANQGATLVVDNTLSNKAKQIKNDLQNLSEDLAWLTPNNVLTFGNNNTEAQFNVNNKDANGIAIFSITDAQVFENGQVSQIIINNNVGASTILINVSGSSITWQTGNKIGSWLTSNDGRSKTLWNFYEANNITFSRDFMGALLAPKASLQTTVDINGSVAVKSLNSTASIRKPYFAGNLCASAVAFSGKIFLQGAYNTSTGLMNATLNTTGILQASATNQPYSGAPWNYSGTEKVGAGFFPVQSSIVDWVLIELRNAASPATVVATRAAFVKTNGSLVDVDGALPITFPGVTAGNYHVAIRHRNHLTIRTASALSFTQGNTTNYDFTENQNKAYQNPNVLTNAAMVSLGNGKFGMWGGNANSNTVVNYGTFASDRLSILTNPNTPGSLTQGLGNNQTATVTNAYSNNDINMNGMVNYGTFGSDRLFLLSTVLQNDQTATKTQH